MSHYVCKRTGLPQGRCECYTIVPDLDLPLTQAQRELAIAMAQQRAEAEEEAQRAAVERESRSASVCSRCQHEETWHCPSCLHPLDAQGNSTVNTTNQTVRSCGCAGMKS